MPIQDNEDNRKKTPSFVEDEQQNQQMQDKTAVQKSGKLLPILNAKAEQHTNRIDNINGKIATQESKISKHTVKIEKLTARADKLEDTNRVLKNMFGDNPLVQSLIKKNEQKIADIRENKIPNRHQKLKSCKNKIGKLTTKRDEVRHKLNRVIALNDTIKSFTISKNEQRRTAFSSAIDRLNTATLDCLSDKKASLESQKNAAIKQFNDHNTDVADKFKLQDKINDLSVIISSVDEKIAKIKPDIKIAEKPPELVDAAIKLTSGKVGEIAENGNISIPEISLDTVTSAQSLETLDKEKVIELAKQVTEDPLKSVEYDRLSAKAHDRLSTAHTTNIIDGVINNGSKLELEQTKAELLAQLAAINNALDEKTAPRQTEEITPENRLEKAVAQGRAEITENGGFKVNPEYYAKLPKSDRRYESMSETQAVEVMAALSAADVAFSAASRGDGKVCLTVAKEDILAVKDIIKNSVGRTTEKYHSKQPKAHDDRKKVHPEYYHSLPKNQRDTHFEPIDTGRKIAVELQRSNIPFSAVVCRNDTVAITVSKQHSQAFRQIESKYHKPKTQEKRADKAYFSRAKLKNDTQRINRSGQKKEQRTQGQEIF